MEKLSEDRKNKVKSLLFLIEKVLSENKLDKTYLREEIEKHFSFILQGKDDINPYARRNAGISDEVWNDKIKDCRKALNLEVNNEKIF